MYFLIFYIHVKSFGILMLPPNTYPLIFHTNFFNITYALTLISYYLENSYTLIVFSL
jgi:hypothetical protein